MSVVEALCVGVVLGGVIGIVIVLTMGEWRK